MLIKKPLREIAEGFFIAFNPNESSQFNNLASISQDQSLTQSYTFEVYVTLVWLKADYNIFAEWWSFGR